VLRFLRSKRAALDSWLTEKGVAHTFSLPVYQLHHHTLPLVEKYATGLCLDAGSGRSPWKPLLAARGIRVLSLDVEDRAGEVDIIADLQDMPDIEDGSITTVLCTQVLEHLPRPWDAIGEICRVLTPGGYLILSVPHLSVIHEAPHDYYRYTRYGLRTLCERSGLEVVQIEESGGLLSFLSHAISMVLFCTLAAVPGLRWITWKINLALIHIFSAADRLLGAASVYPCNYVLLARKPAAAETVQDETVQDEATQR
jgi:SAM-dependent methyltransferase